MRCTQLKCGLGLALLCFVGSSARAQDIDDTEVVDRQVAVLPLEGSRTESIHAQIEQALQSVAIVVPLADVKDAAARLDLSIDEGDDLNEISKELLIDVFIKGNVRGRSKRSVTLTLVDKYGEELTRRNYKGRFGRRLGKSFQSFIEEIYAEAGESLDSIESGDEPEEYDGAEPLGIHEEQDEDDPDRDYLPVLNAQVFVGARTRDALVRLRNSGTRFYEAQFFTDFGIRLHARPYGNKLRPIQGLFADVEFGYAPFVESIDDFGGVFESSALRLMADVGYRFKLDALEIGPVVGIGFDSFNIEERGVDLSGRPTQNQVIPSTSYWYLRLGGVAEYQLMQRLLTVQANLGLRYAIGMSELVPAFGDGGSAIGIDLGLLVSGALDFGLTYAAFIRYTTYQLSFSGGATNPVENGIDGHDRAIYLGLALGYEFY